MSMRGFTLLETLIYLAVFGILMTGFMSGAAAIGESGHRISSFARLVDEETFLMQRIRYGAEYTSAIEINDAASSTILTLGEGASEVQYGIRDTTLEESRAGIPERLLGRGIEVSVFDCRSALQNAPPSLSCDLRLTIRSAPGITLTETSTVSIYPMNL